MAERMAVTGSRWTSRLLSGVLLLFAACGTFAPPSAAAADPSSESVPEVELSADEPRAAAGEELGTEPEGMSIEQPESAAEDEQPAEDAASAEGATVDEANAPDEGQASIAAQAVLTVQVIKTNDANGDGVFTNSEDVFVPFSATVPFSVTITNTSSVPVAIIGLTDANPIGSTPVPKCGGLIGTILFPGQSVICNFTEPAVVPFAGASFRDRFHATVVEVCLDPDAGNCSPCPHPPDLPPPTILCVPGSNIGEGQDESGGRGRDRPPPPPPTPGFTVQKTNNADGVFPFSDAETAPAAGAPVTFQVVVTNTTSGPITITSVTDEFFGQPQFAVCNPALVGMTLAPNQSATCTFTVPNYSPAPGTVRRDVIRVEAIQPCPNLIPPMPCRVTVGDSSLVFTAAPPLRAAVEKTNDADGDGVFTDVESAGGPGQTVEFRIVITNLSSVSLNISSVTDAFPGQGPFPVCVNLIGTSVPPGGSSAPCIFTVVNYAPTEGTSRVDTITAILVQPCEEPMLCRFVTATDPSTVTTPATSPPPTSPPPTSPPPTSPPGTGVPPTTIRPPQSPPVPPSQKRLALTGGPLIAQSVMAALTVVLGVALFRGARLGGSVRTRRSAERRRQEVPR